MEVTLMEYRGINTGWAQERHSSGIERSQEICNVLLQ